MASMHQFVTNTDASNATIAKGNAPRMKCALEDKGITVKCKYTDKATEATIVIVKSYSSFDNKTSTSMVHSIQKRMKSVK